MSEYLNLRVHVHLSLLLEALSFSVACCRSSWGLYCIASHMEQQRECDWCLTVSMVIWRYGGQHSSGAMFCFLRSFSVLKCLSLAESKRKLIKAAQETLHFKVLGLFLLTFNSNKTKWVQFQPEFLPECTFRTHIFCKWSQCSGQCEQNLINLPRWWMCA